MNRSEFEDSYDDSDNSSSESTSSHKYSLFSDDKETNEGVNDQIGNMKMSETKENQVQRTEESCYSSVIRSNTRRYQDATNRKATNTYKDDVYCFDNQSVQSEDGMKLLSTRERKKTKGILKSPITVATFFTDASPNGKNSNEDGIYSKTPAYGRKQYKVQTNSTNRNKSHKRMGDDEQNDPIELSDSDEVRNVKRKRKVENDNIQMKKMKISKRSNKGRHPVKC